MNAPSSALRPVLVALVLLVAPACDNKKTEGTAPAGSETAAVSASAAPSASAGGLPKFDPDQLRLFQPIPQGVETPAIDDLTKLGQMLYFDERLSGNGKTACVTCHDFSKAGADGLVSPNAAKKVRNTPTVFNAGGSFAQGWDARSSTIEEFAPIHTLDPNIMGVADERALVAILESIPAYAAAFRKVFADEKPPVSADTYGRAVGGFTKKLFARARWDKYLGGDKSTMSDAELGGFAMFVEAGCTSCHQGKYIGATQVQKLGMAKPWPAPAGTDPGRYDVTKQEMDRGMWKVPTLRNVARTAPYLHDGSVASLDEMVKRMAHHQVGRDLTEAQAKAIVTFLGALDGDPPKELTAKPALPPSGPKTPKPQ